ncbi:MAG: PLP-dependent aminotransferase family protein, partial [Oscillospiraceae bacterium]|nr:PLP-dependent aminotransferase family protein [Oscillospiraceae bacterium]
DILASNPIAALQYSITEGYPLLREQLTAQMAEKASFSQNDDIIITSGAQQVMDLLSKAIVNEGDAVICEAPSFIGSLNTFRSYNANLVGVPLEDDGISIEHLENALKTTKNVKMIYTIPNFQNPAGVTMSLPKRKAVYELAKKYGVIILEDNPYGDLYYTEEPPANIKTLDTEGIVVYAGTFSKVISPGMRVGYAVGPKAILQKMTVCKQGQDVHTNIWAQIVCSRFLADYDYNGHLEFLRGLYAKKAKATQSLMDDNLAAKGVKCSKINGGLFAWCDLPKNINMPDFVKAAVEQKVCVVPGNAFLTNENDPCNAFRINFTTPTDAQVKQGLEILGGLI